MTLAGEIMRHRNDPNPHPDWVPTLTQAQIDAIIAAIPATDPVPDAGDDQPRTVDYGIGSSPGVNDEYARQDHRHALVLPPGLVQTSVPADFTAAPTINGLPIVVGSGTENFIPRFGTSGIIDSALSDDGLEVLSYLPVRVSGEFSDAEMFNVYGESIFESTGSAASVSITKTNTDGGGCLSITAGDTNEGVSISKSGSGVGMTITASDDTAMSVDATAAGVAADFTGSVGISASSAMTLTVTNTGNGQVSRFDTDSISPAVEIENVGAGYALQTTGGVNIYQSYLNMAGIASSPSVSASDEGRIYYDKTLQKWMTSINGGAWEEFGGSGGGTGTVNYVAKFDSSGDLVDSEIISDGTTIGFLTNMVGQNITSETGVFVAGFGSTDVARFLHVDNYGMFVYGSTSDPSGNNSVSLRHGASSDSAVSIYGGNVVPTQTSFSTTAGSVRMGGGVVRMASGILVDGVTTVNEPAVSPSDCGRLFYDKTLQKWRSSTNAGAYTDLVATAALSSTQIGFGNGSNQLSGSSTMTYVNNRITLSGNYVDYGQLLCSDNSSVSSFGLSNISTGTATGRHNHFIWRNGPLNPNYAAALGMSLPNVGLSDDIIMSQFQAGGYGWAQSYRNFGPTRNMLIGTGSTDNGYKLEVNGTGSFIGALKVTGSVPGVAASGEVKIGGGTVAASGDIVLDGLTANHNIYKNTNSSGTGMLTIQAGGISADWGAGIRMHARSHATYPGDLWLGSSSGAGDVVIGLGVVGSISAAIRVNHSDSSTTFYGSAPSTPSSGEVRIGGGQVYSNAQIKSGADVVAVGNLVSEAKQLTLGASGSGNSKIQHYGTDGTTYGRLTAYSGTGAETQDCLTWGHSGTSASTTPLLGFFSTAPQQKLAVSGSRGSNAALANLLTALATYGLITDSTT